jgi:hypothetical protein
MKNRITSLNMTCDPKAGVHNAYWTAKCEFQQHSTALLVRSRSNCSYYSHSRQDVAKKTLAELFNCEQLGDSSIDGATITVVKWSFGKQSDKRYMNPKNEGCLLVTVSTSGCIAEVGEKKIKMRVLEKMSFELYVVGQQSSEASLELIREIASPKLLAAITTHFNKAKAA